MTYFTLYSYNFCWPVRTLRQRDDAGPVAAADARDGGRVGRSRLVHARMDQLPGRSSCIGHHQEGQWVEITHKSGDIIRVRVYNIRRVTQASSTSLLMTMPPTSPFSVLNGRPKLMRWWGMKPWRRFPELSPPLLQHRLQNPANRKSGLSSLIREFGPFSCARRGLPISLKVRRCAR